MAVYYGKLAERLIQIGNDFGELGEGGLEVVDDVGGDDVGRGMFTLHERLAGRGAI